MPFLIDTDIIIYHLKNRHNVSRWFEEHRNEAKYISVITIGELLYGANKSQALAKNIATVHRIEELYPVLDINRGIIELFAVKKAELEKMGTRLDDMDLLIASTAVYRSLTLVTNNTRHFSRIDDLDVMNIS